MKPSAFEYLRPTSVVAVLDALASSSGRARILAGGQSLVPMMNFRVARPEALIDINRVTELAYHRVEGGVLRIGALARHTDLKESALVRAACPLMSAAYGYVAHAAIRNRGTLCGNLCNADPASEMPAVMQAVDATMVVRSSSGERQVAARDFFVGLYATALRLDELLVEVRVPVIEESAGGGFHEVSVRRGDFAVVAAAATLSLRGQRIRAASLALAGVGDRSIRLPDVESSLMQRTGDAAAFHQAAELAARTVEPQSDPAADSEYRRELVRALVERALRDAGRRAAGETIREEAR